MRERAVADVVDATGERIGRAHRAAPLAREQTDPVEEVAGLPSRHLFAVGVGGGEDVGRAHERRSAPRVSGFARAPARARRVARGGPASTSWPAGSIASSAAYPPATNAATATRG